jgi:hypothetical protein
VRLANKRPFFLFPENFKLKTSNSMSFTAEEKNACSIDAMLNGGTCEACQ